MENNDLVEAKKKIEEEKQTRGQAFGAELNELMKKYRINIVAKPFFTDDGKVSAQSVIVPLD